METWRHRTYTTSAPTIVVAVRAAGSCWKRSRTCSARTCCRWRSAFAGGAASATASVGSTAGAVAPGDLANHQLLITTRSCAATALGLPGRDRLVAAGPCYAMDARSQLDRRD